MPLDLKQAITFLRTEAKNLHDRADKLEEVADFLESLDKEGIDEDNIKDVLKYGVF